MTAVGDPVARARAHTFIEAWPMSPTLATITLLLSPGNGHRQEMITALAVSLQDSLLVDHIGLPDEVAEAFSAQIVDRLLANVVGLTFTLTAGNGA